MAFRNRRFEKRSRNRNRRNSGERRPVMLFARPSAASRAKNGVLFGVAALVILFLFLFLFFNVFGGGSKVKLVRDMKAEIGSHIVASSFVEEIKDGYVSRDQAVDTSSVGKKTCRITVTSNDKKKEKDYEFTVTVIDTKPPVIGVGEVLTVAKDKEVDIGKQALITDNSGEEVQVTASGAWDVKSVADYSIKITATDSSGNKTKKTITLKVIDPAEGGDYSFMTKNGFVAMVKGGVTYVDDVLIVNREYELPKEFGEGLDSEAGEAFYGMIEAAGKEGMDIWATNDFRSWEAQNEIYLDYVEQYGEEADMHSAPPGHSEHQSGLAIDVNSYDEEFANSQEGKWLLTHAWEHGFIIRYPEGKEDVTGYNPEPWHIRYVKKELAEKLYNDGNWITLEEYFGL